MSNIMTFTYNGVNSGDFGLFISNHQQRHAQRKISRVAVPGRNGDVIFPQEAYENVVERYDVYLIDHVDKEVPDRLGEIMTWLTGDGDYHPLTDDYSATTYREAVLVESADFEDRFKTLGKGTLKFDCKPQRFLVDDAPITLTGTQGPTFLAYSDLNTEGQAFADRYSYQDDLFIQLDLGAVGYWYVVFDNADPYCYVSISSNDFTGSTSSQAATQQANLPFVTGLRRYILVPWRFFPSGKYYSTTISGISDIDWTSEAEFFTPTAQISNPYMPSRPLVQLIRRGSSSSYGDNFILGLNGRLIYINDIFTSLDGFFVDLETGDIYQEYPISSDGDVVKKSRSTDVLHVQTDIILPTGNIDIYLGKYYQLMIWPRRWML
ncbi:MAG: hypothetical protein K5637_01995 [Lachnospiraceae bacterium]|nr:hypothetical protein [Lachnospiraceae bacterium]